jgi:RNA polymerase sigma-70 factor, ECF subfamily
MLDTDVARNPSPLPGLEALMAGYQRGDREAAAALIDRVSPQLHRFFMAQVFSRTYAADLLQQTWLRVHEARHTYRPAEPVLPWLYAIARHVRVDSYRKVRRLESREHQMDVLPETPMRDTGSPSRSGPDLEAMLGSLPESQREVVIMLKVSGMSLEEVARATSSSVGSVKQKAHRAYEKLREVLMGLGFGKTLENE